MADDPYDEAVLQRCRRIATATWSDALDALGIAGVMDGIVMRSGDGRIAGPAVTVEESVAPFGTVEMDRFDVGRILRETPPGSVAVVAMGGAPVSTFGGLAARAALKGRIAGVVIDGGCRDVEEIKEGGLYVASRHVTPRSGKLRVAVVALEGPIVCGGVKVLSGDCVIADETGVVAVPRQRLAEALAVAERLDGNDRTFEGRLDAGARFGDVATQLGHL